MARFPARFPLRFGYDTVRLVSLVNPMAGILVARFNWPMQQDATFLSPASWAVTPVSDGAAPLELVEVLGRPTYPEMAIIRYTGGGSTYEMSTIGLSSIFGDPSEGSIEFPINFPGDLTPSIYLFDTIWGPLGISKRDSERRSIDQLVSNRAIAMAVQQQLNQRLAATNGTAGRDGRPGLGRT